MKKILKASIAVSTLTMSLAFGSSAAAQPTYDLGAFPFSYMGATQATATLSTSASGIFTDELAIENILNSASYEATLSGPSGVLTHLDNSNSSWDLMFSGPAAATLTITPALMTLSFSTPLEFTGAALILRSNDLRSVLQYRQENNVFDYNFADFRFDAMFGGGWPTSYETTFVFPAAASVSEPSVAALLSIGLLGTLIGHRSRRRIVGPAAQS